MKVNDQWTQVWKQSWHEVHKSKCPELIKLRDVQRSEELQNKRPWMDHQSTEGAESWHNCNKLGHWPHGLSLLPGTRLGCEKDDRGSQPSISKTLVLSCYISSMDIIKQKSLKKLSIPWSTMKQSLSPSPSRHPEFIDSEPSPSRKDSSDNNIQ